MSDKIKETINNLSQKYEETSWKNILPATFQLKDFELLLSKLLTDKQNGINWTPSFKDFFNSYSSTDIKSLEVIVVTEDPNRLSSDSLLKQGVLMVAVPMFSSGDYLENSKEVMTSMISKLAYQTTGKIFVFIGQVPEEISGSVDNKHHRKVFLPSEDKLKETVNNMLTEPINWD